MVEFRWWQKLLGLSLLALILMDCLCLSRTPTTPRDVHHFGRRHSTPGILMSSATSNWTAAAPRCWSRF